MKQTTIQNKQQNLRANSQVARKPENKVSNLVKTTYSWKDLQGLSWDLFEEVNQMTFHQIFQDIKIEYYARMSRMVQARKEEKPYDL